MTADEGLRKLTSILAADVAGYIRATLKLVGRKLRASASAQVNNKELGRRWNPPGFGFRKPVRLHR
jgi:hypothetical protein